MELKIGILECDHVAPELRSQYDDYHDMFADLVQTQDSSIEINVYDLIGDQFPEDISVCDAYIITGSKFGAYEDIPWIHKAKQLVRQLFDAKIPTIGICFGHQLIAESLGGKVIKAEEKGRGLGVQTWEIKSTPKWMGELESESISLNACHQDQVIEMPKNSELLVSSDFCPIAGFQTDSMLGIQGHPEFGQGYTEYLFNKHNGTLDDKSRSKAIDSFKKVPNSDVVGAWMVNFVKSRIGVD